MNRQKTLESETGVKKVHMVFSCFLFLFWLGSERLKTSVHVRMILPTFFRVFVFFKKTCFPCERSGALRARPERPILENAEHHTNTAPFGKP